MKLSTLVELRRKATGRTKCDADGAWQNSLSHAMALALVAVLLPTRYLPLRARREDKELWTISHSFFSSSRRRWFLVFNGRR